MKLSLRYLPNLERPWLLKREGGSYDQHAHFFKKKEAEKVRRLIENWKYPYKRTHKTAMQRLLTEEEFKSLEKKQRYRNINRGIPEKKRAR